MAVRLAKDGWLQPGLMHHARRRLKRPEINPSVPEGAHALCLTAEAQSISDTICRKLAERMDISNMRVLRQQ